MKESRRESDENEKQPLGVSSGSRMMVSYISRKNCQAPRTSLGAALTVSAFLPKGRKQAS